MFNLCVPLIDQRGSMFKEYEITKVIYVLFGMFSTSFFSKSWQIVCKLDYQNITVRFLSVSSCSEIGSPYYGYRDVSTAVIVDMLSTVH